jgi:DNA-binding MarR family transcriptional regulator
LLALFEGAYGLDPALSIKQDWFVANSKSRNTKAQTDIFLMWQLLRAFIWIDRGLQQSMEARGWPPLSRTESQIMLLVSVGIVRPSDISRSLGLSRQAINQTLKVLSDHHLVDLWDDPDDARCKIVRFAKEGEAIRRDARAIMAELEAELGRRIGPAAIVALKSVPEASWGSPPTVK